jgi:hypothetical protein
VKEYWRSFVKKENFIIGDYTENKPGAYVHKDGEEDKKGN